MKNPLSAMAGVLTSVKGTLVSGVVLLIILLVIVRIIVALE